MPVKNDEKIADIDQSSIGCLIVGIFKNIQNSRHGITEQELDN
jgi:hypothetical protein